MDFNVLILVTFLALTFLHYLYKSSNRRPSNSKGRQLPGPPNFPFIGCLPFILPTILKYKTNYERMRKVAEKYGGIFAAQLGVQYCLHIDDPVIAKEVMSAEEWRNRFNDHPSFYERSYNQPIGLALANGSDWKEMRKFTTLSLRQFGFGKKTTMESSLACELDTVMSFLSKTVDDRGGSGVVDMHLFFNVSILNLLWTMLVGKRFSHDDLKLRELLKFVDKVSKSAPQGLTPVFAFPFLRYIPRITEHDMIIKLHKQVQSLFQSIIDEKLGKGTYLEDPEDFIDAFLQQIEVRRKDVTSSNSDQNVKEKEETRNHYTQEQLIMVCTDLFFTGSDTSSTALEFAFLYMILNPRVQAQVQEEIDRVVGRERQPSLQDKAQMPYTEATTMEILRWSSILPVTSRCNLEDTILEGYFVPKGTIAGINLYSIHFSKKVWDDPYSFRPERFLGNNMEIINGHKIMPFGHGKRSCMGEITARAAIFTFFTSILQKYTFSKSPKHGEPSPEPLSGFTQYPRPYRALVTLRPNI